MTRLAGAYVHVEPYDDRLYLTARRGLRTAHVLVRGDNLDRGLDDLDDILDNAPDHPIADGWTPERVERIEQRRGICRTIDELDVP